MQLPHPLNRLNKGAQRRISLSEKESLFRQDGSTGGLYLLTRGSVELHRFTRDGEAIVLHRPLAGETFAEASLFTSNYHCDAVAVSASEVIELDRSAVLGLFASDQEFAKALAARFASQIQTYRRRFEVVAIRSADERVYTALCDGMLTGDIKSFASEIGLTHEVVYRALAKLVKNGRIEKTARGQYQLFAGRD